MTVCMCKTRVRAHKDAGEAAWGCDTCHKIIPRNEVFDLEERAAIKEYHGGMSREQAEAAAGKERG